MRKMLSITLFVAVGLMTAGAQQEKPKAEVFGGYQYTYGDGLNLNGWNAAVTGNISRSLGLTADFSGVYNGGHVYSFMFGPTFSARGKHLTPFAHALFGGANGQGPAGGSTAFSMAFGGGLDANMGRHFAFRIVQGDWWLLRSNGTFDKNNARVSSGIVVRF